MLGNVKWSLLGYLAIYLGLIVIRNTHMKYSSMELTAAKTLCDDIDNRKVDISDSRLSNFDSDSSDRELNTSELLTVDRVIPLTKTLNRIMEKVFRKLALLITLEDKKILSLQNEYLNLTFLENESDVESERRVFGRNAYLSRLDSLKRVGNAYIAEDTDATIILEQKLQFQILKQSYDFYDENSTYLGGSSFIYNNNIFLLSIEIATNYDNSECRVKNVNFTCVPDQKSLSLRVEGLSSKEAIYKRLKSVLYDNFITKVLPAVEDELLPILTKLVHQADICSYFDAKRPRDSSLVNRFDNNSSF